MQPARASNENGAANLTGNLDILSVSCNELQKTPDLQKVRLCDRMLTTLLDLLEKSEANKKAVKPAIHAGVPQELAESAGGLSDLQNCVQTKIPPEFAFAHAGQRFFESRGWSAFTTIEFTAKQPISLDIAKRMQT